MLDWLKSAVHEDPNLTFGIILARLLFSLLFGCLVAATYCFSQKRERFEMVSMSSTLILLTILITMMTMVIGGNAARAFGIAGALAIIRFRTVVEDTRDTAFVIFAVVIGMAIGADLLIIAVIGLPIIFLTAMGLSYFSNGTADKPTLFQLEVRMAPTTPEQVLQPLFEKYLKSHTWKAAGTAKQGAAIDLRYEVTFKATDSGLNFLSELNRIEGVQSVELRS